MEPHRRVSVRSLLTRSVWLRLLIGWGAVTVTASFGLGHSGMTGLQLSITLAVLVAVIAYCAFGVVEQAEHLARRLGDPYGSLILTLSIVVIEVVLISAVMLGPAETATIARDSVMAVSMVIMNLVVGLALLLGALRHGSLQLNSAGSSTYLAMLIALLSFGLVLPGFIGESGAYTFAQQVVVVVVTLSVYAFFLLRQTTAEAEDYQEATSPRLSSERTTTTAGSLEPQAGTGARPSSSARASTSARPMIGVGESQVSAARHVVQVLREHRAEVLARAGILVITVLPIVLLSHDMASLLDEGLVRLQAPAALAGLLIAVVVFLPESMTALRAGLSGEAQRVINLCHGALVSTVGLTIPAVLIIGNITGQSVVLAESPAHILLLVVSVLLAMNTVMAKRISAGHGAVHLSVFVAYAMTLFG